jgi:hypothetical protein
MTLFHVSDALHTAFAGSSDAIKDVRGKQGLETHDAIARFKTRCALRGLSIEETQRQFARASAEMARGMAACESPIERALLPWLVFQDYGDLHDGPARLHIPKDEGVMPIAPVVIVPQFAFVRFRLDFGIVARAHDCMRIFAIECDGGDFHTAERDAKRDAYLKSWGVETIRLDGRAIYRDGKASGGAVALRLMEWEAGIMERRNGDLS